MVRITDSNVQDFEKKHIAAVRDMAAECAVLLKSNGDFPLASAGKIALFGNGARNTIKGGTGSGDVNVRHFVSVEEGLENAGFEITSKAWLDAYTSMLAEEKAKFLQGLKAEAKAAGVNAIWYCMGKVMPEPAYNIPLEGEAETAVYVLARNSGEGADRTPVAGDINLTETEQRDILALNEKYDKFILVLNVGGMVDLSPVSAVKNILLLSQLGTPTGDVLADILLGKSYPSGKLTTTWAPIASYPSTEGFGDPNDTYYKEGIYVGYRYFDTVNETPVYPFGYGLGYTTFEVKGKSVAADEKQVTVTASVKNTGNFAGKEVVQVYVSAPAGKLDKPYQELKGFAKTKELAPGEETEVTVTFDTASMASFSEEEQKAPYNYQYCIAIPIGTALAQAWNPEACQTCGDIVGEEMEMFGVHMWLAPAMNIHRSPLCGRDFEYYSEDPLVSGCAAAAITKGVQAHKGCATTIKHFCCNNQETNRFLSNSVVSERAMREIYLKGFEICVKTSQPHALMSSYNLVNGEHTCNTKDIQTCALRDEWGYEGVVMTDWLVTRSMGDSMSGTENTNKYSKASAAGCVKAGNDITMPGGEEDFADIMDALSNPQHPYALTRAELQTCAKRVLGSVLKLA